MKILSQMYSWTKKSPLNFGSNPIASALVVMTTNINAQVHGNI